MTTAKERLDARVESHRTSSGRKALDSRGRPKTPGTRWPVLNALVDITLRDLTRSEMATWYVLYRHADKTNIARVSVRHVADSGGMSVKSAHAALASLAARGLVKVMKAGALNRGASVYQVRPTAPESPR